jgi:hypothetical protein
MSARVSAPLSFSTDPAGFCLPFDVRFDSKASKGSLRRLISLQSSLVCPMPFAGAGEFTHAFF